jgi:DNA-directed RNA polymerase specialized sigma24 family protein
VNAGVPEKRRSDEDFLAVRSADAEQVHDDLDEAVETFLEVRPRLMALASRFLSCTSEAEDVVQETWVRWQNTDRTTVADPQALLATMTIRLAINVSHSARWRRETCMTPATTAEHREDVEQAVLIIMESLTPRECAAFVLREAFDYPYGQLSEFLRLGAVNTRQLVSRARRRIGADRRSTVTSDSYRRFLDVFLAAARAGDLTGLEELLAADLPR